MSSTNRSDSRNFHISDYYVTPISDVELFLKEFKKRVDIDWNNIKIVDPCAGGNPKNEFDIEHQMSYPTAINNVFGQCDITTFDIREDSFAENICDYTEVELDFKPDVIITNPPFNQALKIIKKALEDIKDDGYVIVLVRLNFFGSKERKPFFDKYLPEWCFVHHSRISFLDKKDAEGKTIIDSKIGKPKKGSTDSIEYCHMVFRKNNNSKFTKLVVI